MNKHISRFATILIVVLLSACSVLQPSPTLTPTPTDTPTPVPLPTLTPAHTPTTIPSPPRFYINGKISIGDRSLDVFCTGSGSPTVVFENGYGVPKGYWSGVMVEVAKYTRACIYDRANLGESDPAPKPRTSQDMVDDLHAMLTNGQIPGPYLLVGHSMGGYNVLLYANQYPQDVAGLVLVDPTHPDAVDHLQAILPTESPTEAESLKYCRPNPAWDSGQNEPEGVEWTKSAEQVRAIKSLGDVPLTIISAGINGWPCTPDTAELEQQDWLGLHQQYLKLSTNSKQVIAEGANHMVMEKRPVLIVETIKERVDEVRK